MREIKTDTCLWWAALLALALLVGACGDDSDNKPADQGLENKATVEASTGKQDGGDGSVFSCPTTKQTGGSSCTAPEDTQCKWEQQRCSQFYVVNWVCTCKGGSWQCQEDCVDCCRPGDQGVLDVLHNDAGPG